MGVFTTMRRRRYEKKAAYKAAKVQARETAKATAKQDRAREKYLRKTAGTIRSLDAKEAKRQDQKDAAAAKALVAQAKSGRLTAGKIIGWAGAVRAILPILAPLAYRAVAKLGADSGNKGLSSLLGSFGSTDGSPVGADAVQRARIADMRNRIGARNVPESVRTEVTRKLSTVETTLASAAASGSASGSVEKILAQVSTELDLLDAQIASAIR